jgi:hypothetical protein
MRLFTRRRQPEAGNGYAGPPAAEMRGRAAGIADAGALPWEVLWEALKTEPPAEDPSTITQELGLDEEQDLIQKYADLPATEFSGTRYGRSVALRMGVVSSVWRETGAYEVHVQVPVEPFRVRDDDGRLVAEQGAPPEVEAFLAELAPAPAVWRKVVVEGGPDGITARRQVTAHPQGYVYDLWLVERLADRLGA